MARSRHGGRCKRLRDHIVATNRKQRLSQKWSKALHPQSQASEICFLHQDEPFHNLSKSSTSWELRVQKPEPMGDSS